MGGTTTTRSITGLALGLSWMVAAGCTRLNASHCGNQAGDATCRDRGGSTPYCDECEAANDGCVAEPVAAGCGFGDTTSATTTHSTTTGSTISSSTSEVTATDGVDSSGTGVTTCGNGILDEGEACDGATLPAGTSCIAAGYGEGEVGCAADCTALDYSSCSEYVECGNGELAAGEECDADNLDGLTCDDFPQLTGPGLMCNEQCMLDLSDCMSCRENNQPCDTRSDLCCEAKHECRATVTGPRCCIPGTGDCLLALD